MACCTCWMQFPVFMTHWNSKTRPPDPVLRIGRSPKMYSYSAYRSFPSTGGPGVSTQTLSPNHFSGRRPSSRGLSLPQAAGVGVTAIVYAARLKGAIREAEDTPHRNAVSKIEVRRLSQMTLRWGTRLATALPALSITLHAGSTFRLTKDTSCAS
jgi:hypothetical protein